MTARLFNLPFVFTLAFLLLVALLMAGFLPSPVAVVAIECDSGYDTQAYENCQRTQTAEAGGGGGGGQTFPTITNTPATTRTTPATVTPGAQQASPTSLATSTPTATRGPAQLAATPTATSALPDGVEALNCVPGSTVTLTGQAPPNTALLAFFDKRPVGGGLSRPNGTYTIELQIGKERPGFYVVEVRERATRAFVAQFGCQVPAFTPTPTIVTP